MTSTIAVDIDDTLYPFCDLARQVLTEEGFRRGGDQMIAAAYAPWPEWRSPVDLLGLKTWLDIIALCHDDELILSRTPYEGAVDVLWELVESGTTREGLVDALIGRFGIDRETSETDVDGFVEALKSRRLLGE